VKRGGQEHRQEDERLHLLLPKAFAALPGTRGAVDADVLEPVRERAAL